jgi:hypothetical protein
MTKSSPSRGAAVLLSDLRSLNTLIFRQDAPTGEPPANSAAQPLARAVPHLAAF